MQSSGYVSLGTPEGSDPSCQKGLACVVEGALTYGLCRWIFVNEDFLIEIIIWNLNVQPCHGMARTMV